MEKIIEKPGGAGHRFLWTRVRMCFIFTGIRQLMYLSTETIRVGIRAEIGIEKSILCFEYELMAIG